jgi:hypothetical protein
VIPACTTITIPLTTSFRVQVKQKRAQPRSKTAQQAYKTGLQAINEDPDFIVKDVCAVDVETDVVEVVVRQWQQRQKGIFTRDDGVGLAGRVVVVPAHLIRMQIDIPLPPGNSNNSKRLSKKQIVALYKACRVFYVCCAVFWSSRPYYVILGSREMCYCPYHLRFEYQVLGLRHLLVTLHAEKKLEHITKVRFPICSSSSSKSSSSSTAVLQ